MIASTVGLLTIVLAVWLWRVETRAWLRNLGFAALGAVILQGVLGGLRVTLLKDEIGIFHACLAQAFFGMLIIISVATSEYWERISVQKISFPAARRLGRLAIFTTAIIYLQLALGATMRHEHRDLAILDFPSAYGKLIPEVTPEKLTEINAWRDARALSEVTPFHIWLQMTHRFVALIIGAGVIASLFAAKKSALLGRLAGVWFLLLISQITLGAWTIWSNKAADVATAHVAVGATMFAVGVAVSALCLKISKAEQRRSAPERSILPTAVRA